MSLNAGKGEGPKATMSTETNADGDEEANDETTSEIRDSTFYVLSECAIGQAEGAIEDGHYRAAARLVRRARDDLDALAGKLEEREDEQER